MMGGRYDDIINLPHYEPQNHRRMSMEGRAAQFSSFAALSGHEEAIEETARLTDEPMEIEGDDLALLNRKMALLMERVGEHPTVSVTYFVADGRKEGGAYVTHTGRVRRVDTVNGELHFVDRKVIALRTVADMGGALFECINQ